MLPARREALPGMLKPAGGTEIHYRRLRLRGSAARLCTSDETCRGVLDMAFSRVSTVINCADMELMTHFWSQALDLAPSSAEEADDFRVLRGEHVGLSLQLARSPVSARDQMHLDLYSTDQAAEVQRLQSLGATVVRHHRDPVDDYVVMADPEGNEFCICAIAEP
jgi:predicted enzyme related to lactoylglutathione lyase